MAPLYTGVRRVRSEFFYVVAASNSSIADDTTPGVAPGSKPAVVIYGTSWNDPQLVSGETVTNWTTAPYWSQLNGSLHAIDATVITEADPTMVLALPLLEYWLQPTLQPTP